MDDVNQHSSVEECLADIIECSICNDVLQDNRCLPCLHTFCLKCLEKYKQGKQKEKTVPCPVCRREIPTPKCVADLPRNFFIDKIIDAQGRKPPDKPKICEICEGSKNIMATHFCYDCHQHLCQSCEIQHKKIKSTLTHKIVDSKQAPDTQNLSPRPTYCVSHTTKEAEVYCRDCKMVICWRCKSETHNSHRAIEINIAAKDLASDLEKHIRVVAEHVGNKQDDIQKLKELAKSSTDERDIESINIIKEMNKLFKKITDNGNSLKNTLKASTTVHLNSIQAHVTKLEIDVSELKKHRVYIEQMIHLGNANDLCEYTEKLISETVRKATANSVEITVPSVKHLSSVDLQDLLIGRRTDIDQQYKLNSSKERLQEDQHPNMCSKEESANVLEKYKSNSSKEPLQDDQHPNTCSKEESTKEIHNGISDYEDTGKLPPFVVTCDTSCRVVQHPDQLPAITQAPSVKALQIHVQQDELSSIYRNWSLERTFSTKDGVAVTGITLLDSKLYTVFQDLSNIGVYDSTEFVFFEDITIYGLANPNDISSCKFNNCLYVCDWGVAKTCIFRIIIGERIEQMSWIIDGDIGNISVTATHSILWAGYRSSKLKEYTHDGVLMRTITLENGIKPWHAIKLPYSDFLICQGDSSNLHHGVCLVDSNGKLIKSFGGDRGSDEAHLCGPYHLAVDKSGCILVNDCNNRRILLLSPTLRFIKEIIPSSSKLLRRARRIYLDEAAGRLYVADNATTDGETKDGRIILFRSNYSLQLLIDIGLTTP